MFSVDKHENSIGTNDDNKNDGNNVGGDGRASRRVIIVHFSDFLAIILVSIGQLSFRTSLSLSIFDNFIVIKNYAQMTAIFCQTVDFEFFLGLAGWLTSKYQSLIQVFGFCELIIGPSISFLFFVLFESKARLKAY